MNTIAVTSYSNGRTGTTKPCELTREQCALLLQAVLLHILVYSLQQAFENASQKRDKHWWEPAEARLNAICKRAKPIVEQQYTPAPAAAEQQTELNVHDIPCEPEGITDTTTITSNTPTDACSGPTSLKKAAVKGCTSAPAVPAASIAPTQEDCDTLCVSNTQQDSSKNKDQDTTCTHQLLASSTNTSASCATPAPHSSILAPAADMLPVNKAPAFLDITQEKEQRPVGLVGKLCSVLIAIVDILSITLVVSIDLTD